MQGRSLVPLLQGQTPADWRKSFYYHYYEYPEPHHVRPHYGVVTDRYKLVHFYHPDVDYWELFDRKKDPHELRSVYDDPAYAGVVAELKRELDRLRSELKVPAEPPPGASGQSRAGLRAARDACPLTNHCEILVYLRVWCCSGGGRFHKLDVGTRIMRGTNGTEGGAVKAGRRSPVAR